VAAPAGAGGLGARGIRRLLQGLHPRRLSGGALPGGDTRAPLPLPPVDVRRAHRGHARLRPGPAAAPPAADRVRSGRAAPRAIGLPRAGRPGILEPPMMRRVVQGLDDRLAAASFARRALRKAFPDHWAFMLGEIAMYCFIILVLTGTFLTFFYVASTQKVIYHGPYAPLRGHEMSAAYASVLRISYEVRAGLVMRQIHHWAAAWSSRRSPPTFSACSSRAPCRGPGRSTGWSVPRSCWPG